jgi:hypothetical protein
MSYTIEAQVQVGLRATEKADATTSPGSASGGESRTFDGQAAVVSLNAASKPPVSGRVVEFTVTLAGASQDLDLTAIPVSADVAETFNATGLKLVGLVLQAPWDNPGNVGINGAVANGYPILGAVALVLTKGMRLSLGMDGESQSGYTNPNQAVDGTHKIVQITGAAGYKLKGRAVFGT